VSYNPLAGTEDFYDDYGADVFNDYGMQGAAAVDYGFEDYGIEAEPINYQPAPGRTITQTKVAAENKSNYSTDD
jgi:hypothetical protein